MLTWILGGRDKLVLLGHRSLAADSGGVCWDLPGVASFHSLRVMD